VPVFQVEMRWRCSACHAENLGRHKRCQHCTKAKDVEKFYDAPGAATPSVEQAVTDPLLIAAATAGADWACGYCRVAQPARNDECANCGAPRNDPEHPGIAVVDQGPDATTPAPRQEDEVAPAPTLADVAAQATREAEAQGARIKRGWTIALAAALALAGVFGLWLVFRSRVLEAHVVQRAWEHTVVVERYQIVQRESFEENRPAEAFDIVAAGERHHHNDRVQDGTERESYTERVACGEDCSTTSVTCTENDNGFKTCSGGDRVCSTRYCSETRYREVPRYKSVPVYQTWYRWSVWQWKVARMLREKGTTEEPRWPSEAQIALGAGCRAGEQERERREAKYEVVFADEETERHPYRSQSLEEFAALPLGAKRTIRVGRAQETELVDAE
jgi:hypothetical protein